MYQIDFKKPMHIHFIGIGGISMSGLASILLKQHFKVSGSDAHESELTKQLEAEGAILYYGQRASNLDDTPDLVVYTAAIHPDNPEYAAAVAKQIPMLSRAELLGQMILSITDDNIELKIQSQIGSMDEEIDINKEGKDIMIGFNPRFLIDALRVIDDETVDIYLMNPKAPCFIRDEQQSYIYLILPVNFMA